MASQVLSGSSNASYTNNTGQNVRVVISYMSNCTSISWAGVTVTGSSSVVSKDTLEILGEFKAAVPDANKPVNFITNSGGTIRGNKLTSISVIGSYEGTPGPFGNISFFNVAYDQNATPSVNVRTSYGDFDGTPIEAGNPEPPTLYLNNTNIFYVPTSIRPGGVFPTELILENGQTFSAVCGAYNIVVIKEDGT